MAKNQHNAGLHYRPLNQLGLSNFNDYIENPIDSRFKFNPPPLKCGKLFGLCKADRQKEKLQKHLTAGTQLIRQLYGEGPELCDWLEGIRHHGDYRLCGYVCPEYGSLPEQKRLEEQLKKQVQEMEELYETRNCI